MKPHFPEIDGLRAIAVLAVLIFHVDPHLLPAGYLGVDLFFVISGFVVTHSVQGLFGNFKSFVIEFYSRRMARLFPSLFLVLSLTVLLSVLFLPYGHLTGNLGPVASYSFIGLGNWSLLKSAEDYFSLRAELNPFTHTWSLGIEEQFYLLFPLLLLIHQRGIRGPFVLTTVFIASGIAFLSADSQALWFYSPFHRAWQLALGCLLWSVWERSRPIPQRYAEPLALASIMTWLGLCLWTNESSRTTHVWGSGLSALMIASCLHHPVLLGLLRSVIAQSIGKASYAIYLIHWPLSVGFRWTLGLEGYKGLLIFFSSIFLGILLTRFFEDPLRKKFKHLRPSRVVLVGALSCLIFYSLSKEIFDRHRQLSVSTVSRNASTWYPDAFENEISVIPGPYGMIFQAPSEVQKDLRVFVVGDSHAGVLYPTLKFLASKGFTVRFQDLAGCAWLTAGTDQPACQQKKKEQLQWLKDEMKAGDVLVLPGLRTHRWPLMHESDDLSLPKVTPSPEDFEKALLEVLPLTEKQIRVIIELPKPLFRIAPYQCADPWTRVNPDCEKGILSDRKALLSFSSPMRNFLSDLAQEFRSRGISTQLWNSFDLLCPEGPTCSPFDSEGKPLFFDHDHLSTRGNEAIRDSLLELILASR